MRGYFVFLFTTVFLLTAGGAFAQQDAATASPNQAFWISYWAQPKVILFGAEEEEFYKNISPIKFAWDEDESSSNPHILDGNVQWLKEHANVRFYIEGYASSRGDWDYNLLLSQRRADWVKRTLISNGIAENRIVMAVGWGQTYPTCPELNDECWSKNRLVRFVYSPS